jgi:hypothetical protein
MMLDFIMTWERVWKLDAENLRTLRRQAIQIAPPMLSLLACQKPLFVNPTAGRSSIMRDMSVLSIAMPPGLKDSSCMRYLLKFGPANESLRDTLGGADESLLVVIRTQNLLVLEISKATIAITYPAEFDGYIRQCILTDVYSRRAAIESPLSYLFHNLTGFSFWPSIDNSASQQKDYLQLHDPDCRDFIQRLLDSTGCNACHLTSGNANARRCGIDIPARDQGRPSEVCESLDSITNGAGDGD